MKSRRKKTAGMFGGGNKDTVRRQKVPKGKKRLEKRKEGKEKGCTSSYEDSWKEERG